MTLKFIRSTTLGVLFGSAVSLPAAAGDALDVCETAQKNDGEDPSICSCIVDAASGDKDLLEEIVSLSEISDREERRAASSSALEEIVNSCA